MKLSHYILIVVPIIIGLNIVFFSFFKGKMYLDEKASILNTKLDDEKKCVQCHSIFFEKKVIHAPIEESCENCHVKNNETHPNANIKGFDLMEKDPELCLICHDDIKSKKKIHAPIEDGNCNMCHSPHSSDYLHLLHANPSSKLCYECHDADKTENKMVHKPYEVGDCTGCHDPHQSDFSFSLKSETVSLCVSCHTNVQEEMKKENVHAPAQDDCMNCHKAHMSNEKYLLDQTVSDLCYSCHDPLDTKKKVHNPVQKGDCNLCHTAHASSEKSFLLMKEQDLCLSCHKKTIWKTYKTKEQAEKNLNLHGAIEIGGCSVCHDPHTSDNNYMLTKNFPIGSYALSEANSFEICFECHESELFKIPVTENATNFRNGNQNLHYLHINGTKGRSCVNCHDMHGSVSKKLISKRVMYGEWEMPIKYEPTKNGGSCTPGCHGETIYVR